MLYFSLFLEDFRGGGGQVHDDVITEITLAYLFNLITSSTNSTDILEK